MSKEEIVFNIKKRKELIPMGFKFNKYWASNYIGYTYKMREYDNSIILWLAGKDLQTKDIPSEVQVPLYKFFKKHNSFTSLFSDVVSPPSKMLAEREGLTYVPEAKYIFKCVNNEIFNIEYSEYISAMRYQETQQVLRTLRAHDTPETHDDYIFYLEEQKKAIERYESRGYKIEGDTDFVLIHSTSEMEIYQKLIENDIIMIKNSN